MKFIINQGLGGYMVMTPRDGKGHRFSIFVEDESEIPNAKKQLTEAYGPRSNTPSHHRPTSKGRR